MEFLKITNTHSKDPLFTSMPRFVIQLQKFSSHAKAAGIKLPAAYTHILYLYILKLRHLSSAPHTKEERERQNLIPTRSLQKKIPQKKLPMKKRKRMLRKKIRQKKRAP